MSESKTSTGSQPPASRLVSPGEEIDTFIALYFERLQAGGLWGLSTSIALEACEAAMLEEEQVRDGIEALSATVLHLAVRRPAAITCLGEGYALVSSPGPVLIAAHMSNRARAVALDLFGLVAYSPAATARWCRRFFGSQRGRVSVALRGLRPRQMVSCLLML
jgi:hypothetical protein